MQLTLEFTCVEERASLTGQRAKLLVPIPPPLPVQDGFGKHIAHPPPPGGALTLMLTSPERQKLCYAIDELEREIKPLRPELAADDAHRKELADMRAKLEKKLGALIASATDLKEFRLEHGEVYEVTISKKGKAPK